MPCVTRELNCSPITREIDHEENEPASAGPNHVGILHNLASLGCGRPGGQPGRDAVEAHERSLLIYPPGSQRGDNDRPDWILAQKNSEVLTWTAT